MAVEETLIAWMRGVTNITDKVRYRIFPVGEVPQGTRLPYITYEVDVRPTNTADGDALFDLCDLTLHVFDDGFKATRDLMKTVRDELRNASTGLAAAKADVSSAYLRDVTPIFHEPTDSSDEGRHRQSMSVDVWYHYT